MPRICPSCDGTLPHRSTGRPAVYCSQQCRQAAHRARQRARTAAEHAAWVRAAMVRELDHAAQVLQQARALLDGPLAEAEHAIAAAEGEPWHVVPPTGWEERAGELAAIAGRCARSAESYLREHRQTVSEQARALRVAGIRRAPAEPRGDDETPRGSVATADAAAAATKPAGADVDREPDRDAVFAVVEDLVDAVDDVAAEGGPLMSAVADPYARLADVWAAQAGDGPIGEPGRRRAGRGGRRTAVRHQPAARTRRRHRERRAGAAGDETMTRSARVMSAAARCLAAVAVTAGCAAGCNQPAEARGVVVARPYLYIGSSYTHYLKIRQANGSTVRQRVGSRTWHRCQVGERYPQCDHG